MNLTRYTAPVACTVIDNLMLLNLLLLTPLLFRHSYVVSYAICHAFGKSWRVLIKKNFGNKMADVVSEYNDDG